MLMTWIWLGMVAAAVLYGAAAGTLPAVSAAVTSGAGDAVTLCVGLAGALLLWSALMELLRQSGLLAALTRLLRPLLRRVYPTAFAAPDGGGDDIALNFTANLLGLGSAATPPGLRAAKALARQGRGAATAELVALVVMNSASVQLLPATVAALRASLGAAAPFDILPCVWLTSLCSVAAGLASAKLLGRLFPG
jgi:spore maturation protein A